MRVELLHDGALVCAGETIGDRLLIDERFNGWWTADEFAVSDVVRWADRGEPWTVRSVA